MSKKLKITNGKGFYIGFENGWGVSVQFGPGNYADNYGMRIGESDAEAGKQGSDTAECACFNSANDMVELPAFMFADDYRDIVSNRSTTDQVLRLMNWASSQEMK